MGDCIVFKRLIIAAAAAAVSCVVGAAAVTAAEPTVIDATPELQGYTCGADFVSAAWTLHFSGGNGTYSWTALYGDGTSSSGTATGNINRSHTFHPHFACRDYTQTFSAQSAGGGSSSDQTRVIWTP